MRKRFVLAMVFCLVSVCNGQTDNTFYAKNFQGPTVGAKVSAAAASCITSIPCVIIIDPSLAAYPAGTLATFPSSISILDYRQPVSMSGSGGSGGPASFATMTAGTNSNSGRFDLTLGVFDALAIGPSIQADEYLSGYGNDWCLAVLAAYNAQTSPPGFLIDARKLTGSQSCGASLAIPANTVIVAGENMTLTMATGATITLGQNSRLVGLNRQTSKIIGNVSGGGVVQFNSDSAELSEMWIQNLSAAAGSADISVNANHATVRDVSLANSYVPLYIAQTANAYYGNYSNIYTGNGAGVVYNSIQIGNSSYQGNGSKLDLNFLQIAGGSNSCLDNEGSSGVMVTGFDCENGSSATYSAIIDNEAGTAEPSMGISGGYVQIGNASSTNYCVTGTNGFLQLYSVNFVSCNGFLGSVNVANFGSTGPSNAGLANTSFNLTAGPGGRIYVAGNSAPGVTLQDNLANPCLNFFESASETLTVSDCNNNPATFSYQVYGSIKNAGGTVVPYFVNGYNGNSSGLRIPLSLPFSGTAGVLVCDDGNHNLTESGCASAGGGFAWNAVQSVTASSGAASVNWSTSNAAKITANGGNVTISFAGTPASGEVYFLSLCNDGSPRSFTPPSNVLGLATPALAGECTAYKPYLYDGTNFTGPNSTATPTIIYGVERAAPITSASGAFECWWDSTNHVMTCNDNGSASVSNLVTPVASSPATQVVNGIDATGTQHTSTLAAITNACPVVGNASDLTDTIGNQTSVALQIVSASCSISTPATSGTIDGTHHGLKVVYNFDGTASNSPTWTPEFGVCPTANISGHTCSSGFIPLLTLTASAESATVQKSAAIEFDVYATQTAGTFSVGVLRPQGNILASPPNSASVAVCGATCTGGSAYSFVFGVQWLTAVSGTCNGVSNNGSDCLSVMGADFTLKQ